MYMCIYIYIYICITPCKNPPRWGALDFAPVCWAGAMIATMIRTHTQPRILSRLCNESHTLSSIGIYIYIYIYCIDNVSLRCQAAGHTWVNEQFACRGQANHAIYIYIYIYIILISEYTKHTFGGTRKLPRRVEQLSERIQRYVEQLSELYVEQLSELYVEQMSELRIAS